MKKEHLSLVSFHIEQIQSHIPKNPRSHYSWARRLTNMSIGSRRSFNDPGMLPATMESIPIERSVTRQNPSSYQPWLAIIRHFLFFPPLVSCVNGSISLALIPRQVTLWTKKPLLYDQILRSLLNFVSSALVLIECIISQWLSIPLQFNSIIHWINLALRGRSFHENMRGRSCRDP